MSQFAKDVAKQLDRRQQRRRLATLGVLATAAALAAMYLRCGSGFGLGSGTGTGSGTSTSTVEKRCSIKVSAQGIFVDGKKQTQEGAVAICKKAAGADVIVTGDAREGDWKDLDHALEAEHVDVFLRDH